VLSLSGCGPGDATAAPRAARGENRPRTAWPPDLAAPSGIVDGMNPQDTHRHVAITRVGASRYTVTNERGGTIGVGDGSGGDFTPVELLLTAIAGCTAIDVDVVTSRRAEPGSFLVEVDADKVRDEGGNHLTDIVVTFRVAFPDGADGDKARAILPDIVRRSSERLCIVSRTIELGTPVTPRIA
jgi:putative redox protein